MAAAMVLENRDLNFRCHARGREDDLRSGKLAMQKYIVRVRVRRGKVACFPNWGYTGDGVSEINADG